MPASASYPSIGGVFDPSREISMTNLIETSGAIRSYGRVATAGIGYSAGAGGIVTQATNKSTGVTLNRMSGAITMNGAALNDATTVGFVVTNSCVGAADTISLNIKSDATANAYIATVGAVSAGSFRIEVRNVSGGGLSEAIILSFNVIKGSIT